MWATGHRDNCLRPQWRCALRVNSEGVLWLAIEWTAPVRPMYTCHHSTLHSLAALCTLCETARCCRPMRSFCSLHAIVRRLGCRTVACSRQMQHYDRKVCLLWPPYFLTLPAALCLQQIGAVVGVHPGLSADRSCRRLAIVGTFWTTLHRVRRLNCC